MNKAAASTLAHMQAGFQAAVLATENAKPSFANHIDSSFGLAPEERMAIYVNAYRLRLFDALADAFAITQTYIGDDLFMAIGRRFIEQHPPTHYNLRWFGDAFPAFLAKTQESPLIAELAAFEWALGVAFDAANAPVLSTTDIQALHAEDWQGLGFVLQPSLQILTLVWNTPAIWLALKNGETPPVATSSPMAHNYVIWRKEWSPHFRSLDPHESQALQACAKGQSFAEICAHAAAMSEDDITPQIATWLATWLRDGILATVTGLDHHSD